MTFDSTVGLFLIWHIMKITFITTFFIPPIDPSLYANNVPQTLKSWDLFNVPLLKLPLLSNITQIKKLKNINSYICLNNSNYRWLILFCRKKWTTYKKVASSNSSRLGAHEGFFRLLMKGIFDPYVLGPFDKKLIS